MAGHPAGQRPGSQQVVQQALQLGRTPASHRLSYQRTDIHPTGRIARRHLTCGRIPLARHTATLAASNREVRPLLRVPPDR